jgi:hypothetical protein
MSKVNLKKMKCSAQPTDFGDLVGQRLYSPPMSHRNPQPHVLRTASIWMLAILLFLTVPKQVFAQHPCDPPNVIAADICNMDSFRGEPPRQIPNGWNEFILSGEATFMQDNDTYWGPPSLRIWSSGGTFKVGIYTQVNVSPGAGYRASIAWGAPNAPETFGRQLGIDPTGGTDPTSQNVIWGPMHWGPGRILNYPPPDVNIDVRARAQGGTVTVFFLVDHPTSTGDNLIFVDAIALYPDESAPGNLAPPADTATPEPTHVPTSVPPEAVAPFAQAATLAPVVPPTATPVPPTDTPTPEPTSTPTDTPTPSPTPTETPTVTPTWTPWPMSSPAASTSSIQNTISDLLPQPKDDRERLLLLISFAGLGGATVFGSSWWWVRRQR